MFVETILSTYSHTHTPQPPPSPPTHTHSGSHTDGAVVERTNLTAIPWDPRWQNADQQKTHVSNTTVVQEGLSVLKAMAEKKVLNNTTSSYCFKAVYVVLSIIADYGLGLCRWEQWHKPAKAGQSAAGGNVSNTGNHKHTHWDHGKPDRKWSKSKHTSVPFQITTTHSIKPWKTRRDLVFWFWYNAYILNTKGPSRSLWENPRDTGQWMSFWSPSAWCHPACTQTTSVCKVNFSQQPFSLYARGSTVGLGFIIDVFSTRSILYVTDALRTLRYLSILSAKGTFLHAIVPLIHTYKDASLNCG